MQPTQVRWFRRPEAWLIAFMGAFVLTAVVFVVVRFGGA